MLLARIALDAAGAHGTTAASTTATTVSHADALDDDVAALKGRLPHMAPDVAEALVSFDTSTVLDVLDAWTLLFGMVSFELFGHYHDVLEARADYLDRLAMKTAAALGLSG